MCPSEWLNKAMLLQFFFHIVLLRSEIPRSKRAKLHTVALIKNRGHMPWSLFAYASHHVHNLVDFLHAAITLLVLAHATYIWVLFIALIPFVVNHTFNATPTERLQP